MPDQKKKKPGAHPEPDAKDVGFEEAVERLEAIIERIESGEIGLEESVTEYERGVALIRRARSILEKAEQRIAELTPGADDASSDASGGSA